MQGFAAPKNTEQTAMDTGLTRNTVGPLLERLRMVATLVSQRGREDIKFEHCEVEADGAVVRKERVYEGRADPGAHNNSSESMRLNENS